MKNILFRLQLLLLLGIYSSSQGQRLFTVIFSDKCIKTDQLGNQTYLRTGQSIYPGDEIDIMLTGVLGLIHKNGKTIELKTSGRYKTDSLLKLIGDDSSRFSLKLLPFLKARERDNGRSMYRYDFKGAYVYSTLNTKVIPGDITICWQSVGRSSKCEVTLTNQYDEVFFKGVTTDSCITIDLTTLDFSKLDPDNLRDREFQFSMHDELNPKNFITDHVFIELLDEKGLQRISTGETELNKVNPPTSIVNLLLLAALYETEDLYLNAMDKYQKAITLYPESNDLKILYDGFLYRNGLVLSGY